VRCSPGPINCRLLTAKMNIIRVFPRKTSLTPVDELSFIGEAPLPLFMPKAEEVHISVTFTWDIEEGYRLLEWWGSYYPVVKIGGPAFHNNENNFIPGRYIKQGVTFTTKGCNNNCPWCMVPDYEGKLVECDHFPPGWIIQDNNLLQASTQHIDNVFSMLRKQKRLISFPGGIQASLINDNFIEQLKTIRIDQLFLAADTLAALKPLSKAIKLLSFLTRRQIRVYCLIGMNETIDQAKSRLETIWELGALPFAQLYQPPDHYINYSKEWRSVSREWTRPAAMYANHERIKSC
jgi:hypothetical protein